MNAQCSNTERQDWIIIHHKGDGSYGINLHASIISTGIPSVLLVLLHSPGIIMS